MKLFGLIVVTVIVGVATVDGRRRFRVKEIEDDVGIDDDSDDGSMENFWPTPTPPSEIPSRRRHRIRIFADDDTPDDGLPGGFFDEDPTDSEVAAVLLAGLTSNDHVGIAANLKKILLVKKQILRYPRYVFVFDTKDEDTCVTSFIDENQGDFFLRCFTAQHSDEVPLH